jgi:hypothetical protein
MVVDNRQSLKDIIIGINFPPSSICWRKITFNQHNKNTRMCLLCFAFDQLCKKIKGLKLS